MERLAETPALKRLRAAVGEVEAAMRALALPIEQDIPSELRYKLLVAACSINDYVLWIEELDEDGPYGKRWRCNEIESGTHKDGDHAAQAVFNYFGPGAFADCAFGPTDADTPPARPGDVREGGTG